MVLNTVLNIPSVEVFPALPVIAIIGQVNRLRFAAPISRIALKGSSTCSIGKFFGNPETDLLTIAPATSW